MSDGCGLVGNISGSLPTFATNHLNRKNTLMVYDLCSLEGAAKETKDHIFVNVGFESVTGQRFERSGTHPLWAVWATFAALSFHTLH